MHSKPQSTGQLDLATLRGLVESGDIQTVIVAFPDMYGRLLGKRYTGQYFLEAADHGMHFCDYLLASDMEMDPVPGYAYASWDQGYSDATGVVDWSTLRQATWLEKSALVLCDIHDETDHSQVEIAPRTILRRQMDRAQAMGYLPMGASELEFFIFQDSYEAAHEKSYHDLQTFGNYIEDYHIFQGTKIEGLMGAIRWHLQASGIPTEFSKGEWGAGQREINIRYADFLTMADRTIIYKQCAKEIAHQQDLSLTFMAKWDERHAGSSMHIHCSLWDTSGERNLFAGEGESQLGLHSAETETFRWFLGGLLAHARELALFHAPYVNSYKRYLAESFAPTGIAWSYDNRTAGFRIVGHGQSLRIESRIPGADANPYLAFAAMLAAGLDGIEKQTEPPAMFKGDVYAASELQHVPRTLNEAIAEFERSALAREAFGDEVVEHYLHYARTEQRKFDEVVTCWERARFFERA